MNRRRHVRPPFRLLSRLATRWALVSMMWTFGPSLEAAAARPPVRSPTDGVDRVYHDYAGDGDASSIELNPALLSASRGFDLTLLGYMPIDTFQRGRGIGGFVALGSRFGIASGLGFQLLLPSFRDDTFDASASLNPSVTKVSWALSGGNHRYASLGFGIHGIRADGRWLQRPDVDVGITVRATNYASLGANLRLSPVDLRSDTLPGMLRFVAELVIRPLGTHTIELAGGLTQAILTAKPGDPQRRGGLAELLGRGRISVRYQGLAVRGEVEQIRVQTLDQLIPFRSEKAVRGSVSVEASWDFASVGAGLHAGIADSGGVDGWGMHARFHTRRRGRVFWPRRIDIERIHTDQIDDQRALIHLLIRLERARSAGRRTVLLVDARHTSGGWASLHETRRALIRVRNAGGHVYAYLENATLRDYYLASAAQEVFMHPAGSLSTVDLSRTALYFKTALDKLGVSAEVIKTGDYKSAAERFTRSAPSPAEREQRDALRLDQRKRIIYDIAQARRTPLASVDSLLQTAPLHPEQAKETGWVDDVLHCDELPVTLSERLEAQVSFANMPDSRAQDPTWSTAPYIAVIVIDGTLVDGESRWIPLLDLSFTGVDTVTTALREARRDPACRGIVVRIDSPGGSALAADVLWREIERTQHEHDRSPRSSPPIVASLSDVAASGGYYAAVGAKTILSDELSITGSIGVISLNWDAQALLNRLGIAPHTFGTGDHVDPSTMYAPYTVAQRERLESAVQHTYELFVQRVATGRGFMPDGIDQRGRGRIFSGQAAKDAGLVDALGGLHEAIILVRKRGQVPRLRDLELRILPEEQRLIDLILDNVGDPFMGVGPIRKVVARKRAEAQQRRATQLVPAALNSVLERLPLALLYLTPRTSLTLAPWLPRM